MKFMSPQVLPHIIEHKEIKTIVIKSTKLKKQKIKKVNKAKEFDMTNRHIKS